MEALEANCDEFGIPVYSLGSDRQGIVHIIGPELGVTQPGMTIVCGDSHTATHGAFGALAFGIGTSEVEHVLATQTLSQPKPKSMRINYVGELGHGVTAKDLILGTIGQMGTNGAAGHVVEFAGDVIRALSMEAADDDLQHDDRGRRPRGHDRARRDDVRVGQGPRRARRRTSRRRSRYWRTLKTDEGATFDREITVDASKISPLVTWGTNPGQVVGVAGEVPAPTTETDERSLVYMGLEAGTPITELQLDRVFIGSCTNGRIGDLRAAAEMIKGRKVASTVKNAMVVPGSVQVAKQAESEGLDEIFREAGFDWRTAGCSMCLGMNPDTLRSGRALRVHLQPQLRGPPGPRRAHPPRLAGDGRGRRHRGPLRRHPGVELDGRREARLRPRHVAQARGRGHGPDHPQAVPQADRAHRLR